MRARKHFKVATNLIALLVLGASGDRVRAVTITSGNLHASSSAQGYPYGGPVYTVNDTPADKAFISPSTSQSTAASANGYSSSGSSLSYTASQSAGTLSIHADGGGGNGPPLHLATGADGLATFTVTEDQIEFLKASISANSFYCSSNVTLLDAGGAQLFRISSSSSAPLTFKLNPGVYTLEWSGHGGPAVGTGGQGASDFTLAPTTAPEPSCLALLACAALVLRRARK